jgi:hypothetical protein
MLMARGLIAVLLLASMPFSAFAQERSSAAEPESTDDRLIADGVSLRKAGKDAAALALFEIAYAQHPSARAVAQMALAHQALGQWREAERGLVEAMRSSDDAWVARERVYLEEGLAAVRAHLAWLDVDSNLAAAEIWIGGEHVATLPLSSPLRVTAGTVIVEARAPGHPPFQRTMSIDGGTTAHATFALLVDSHASVADERSSGSMRTAGWITLSISGGLLLAGIAGEVTREREAQIYDDDSQCGPSAGQSRNARCGTNRDIGSAAETLGIAALAGAGVGFAIAAGLLHGGSAKPSARVTARGGCGVTGSGLGCSGTF